MTDDHEPTVEEQQRADAATADEHADELAGNASERRDGGDNR